MFCHSTQARAKVPKVPPPHHRGAEIAERTPRRTKILDASSSVIPSSLHSFAEADVKECRRKKDQDHRYEYQVQHLSVPSGLLPSASRLPHFAYLSYWLGSLLHNCLLLHNGLAPSKVQLKLKTEN